MSAVQRAAQEWDLCLQNRTVYAKLDGGWRVISSQGSLIHDGPIVNTSHDGLPGTYAVEGGGGTFTVTEIGRTLFGGRTAAQRSPMFETPDGGFEGPLGRWRFAFQRDDQGRATGVTFSTGGKELWRAKRAE